VRDHQDGRVVDRPLETGSAPQFGEGALGSHDGNDRDGPFEHGNAAGHGDGTDDRTDRPRHGEVLAGHLGEGPEPAEPGRNCHGGVDEQTRREGRVTSGG